MQATRGDAGHGRPGEDRRELRVESQSQCDDGRWEITNGRSHNYVPFANADVQSQWSLRSDPENR